MIFCCLIMIKTLNLIDKMFVFHDKSHKFVYHNQNYKYENKNYATLL